MTTAAGMTGVLVMVWITAAIWLDRHGRCSLPPGDFDAIVVAGCRVRADGEPTRALRRRAALAAELWLQGRAPVVVLTGGPGPRHPRSEARAAARCCAEQGIPERAMVLEELSRSTEQNARCAAGLVPGARVVIVSDAYHVFRCRRMFRRHFPDVHAVGAVPPMRERIRMSLREVIVTAGHALRAGL